MAQKKYPFANRAGVIGIDEWDWIGDCEAALQYATNNNLTYIKFDVGKLDGIVRALYHARKQVDELKNMLEILGGDD